MPGPYYEQGRDDARNGQFNQLFYHTYLDYKLGYDEVMQGPKKRGFGSVMRLLLLIILALSGGWLLRDAGFFAAEPLPIVMVVTPTVATATPTFPFVIATAESTSRAATPTVKPRTAVVATAGGALRVRPEPGLAGEPVGTLQNGTIVTIIGGPQERDDYQWWQIQTNTIEGWAAADFLRLEE